MERIHYHFMNECHFMNEFHFIQRLFKIVVLILMPDAH